ncbi:hypothetical protein [uncultured Desulfovibrio sp.]|uniref:hypothetical protein n=1 Tax=uncultured Desulfovibrio sp. TaxID=167968 RepID=UPI00272CE2A9|nr:hypothetical protein [uncultured Desulfovibrio sp.]
MQQAHPEQQRKHRDQLGAGRGLPGAGRGVMAVPGDGLEDDFSGNLWYSVKDIKNTAGNASWRRGELYADANRYHNVQPGAA